MPVNKLKILILFSLIALVSFESVRGQYSNTYYWMYGIPQANQLNPSFQSGCRAYVALPFARARFGIESSSVGYNDIFSWDNSSKKFITFLHPNGDKNKFMNALKPENTIRAVFSTSILSVGWRMDNLYFTIDLSELFEESFIFSKDFMELLINGNKNQANFNIGDLGNDLSYYHSLALGASYHYDDNLQFGARLKLLGGLANITSRKSEGSLNTSLESWDINTNYKIDASLPYIDLPIDSEGNLNLDSIGAEGAFDLIFGLPTKLSELISPTGFSTLGGIRNPGVAIDLGFNYKPIDKLSVGVSIVDLGFIRWRGDVYNFNQQLNYSFQGIEINKEALDDENWDPGKAILDSINSQLVIPTTQNAYTDMLTSRIFLGAAYDLTEKVRFGAVLRSRIYRSNFYSQFTLSANVQPISLISASLSYSIMRGNFMNLGVGLSLRAGPFNIYFITDQAPSTYFWPESTQALNYRMGLNLVFGCRKVPKEMKDKPLVD